MSVKVECKIIRTVFSKDNFRIYGCQPLNNKDELTLSKYGTITILGDLSYLEEGKIYTLELEMSDKQYNGEFQYSVVSVPTLEIEDVDNMSAEEDMNILMNITTTNLAKAIHKTYPNYCQLILQGKENEIDLKKIKGVKEFRHNVHVRKINENYKYYHLQIQTAMYKLSTDEAKNICNRYNDVKTAIQQIQNNPYYTLCGLCGRDFPYVDKLVLKHNPDLRDSSLRCEYFIYHLLQQNELKGNTYMDASVMANSLDRYVIKQSLDVALKSDIIYYDTETNHIGLQYTYDTEKSIASFVSHKVNNSEKLDWDWQKFKVTKDGELTEEQQNVLKEFCEHNFLILDASAGTGKSTSMMSLIRMCEEYDYSYKLLAPTGKASKRLSESTNREASTIHRGTNCGEAELWQDVIIVDEASMLNLETTTMLFKCICNSNARILLLMDIEQLPPIGLGCVAKELIDSGVVPTCTLTKVFRFSSGGMIKTTTLARKGEWYLEDLGDKDSIILGKEKDYEFIVSNKATTQIINKYMEYINNGVKVDDVIVLTPRNIGTFGTYNLNNLIQERINPIKPKEAFVTRKIKDVVIKFHVGDLVMVTKNNYNMLNWQKYDEMMFDEELTKDDMGELSKIFNGEIGEIVGFSNSNDDNEVAMKVLINEEIIMFTKNDIDNLLLGYCTTIYKFQGSQIPYPIILTLDTHRGQLNKELLYTNLSRGQKKVTEIGDVSAVQYSLGTLASINKKNNIASILVNIQKEDKIDDGRTEEVN